MRKFLLVLPALALLVAVPAGAKNFVINPQAGVVGQDMTGDVPDLDDTAKLGYGIGGNLRFGGRGYLSPGIFWEHTSLEATVVDDATLESVTDNLEVKQLRIPLHVGYNLSSGDAMSMSSLGFRVFGGPSATMVMNVDDNAFGVTKDDYKGTIWGAQVGAGVDLSSVTIDASYEWGLSNVFKDDADDKKHNVARGLVGLKF
jgi:outer membrane protein with beta-barrel domain